MEAVFSTKTLIFRLASVYSDFPKNPEKFRRYCLEGYIDEEYAKYKFEKVLNICHYRWCVIKGFLKAILAAIIGGVAVAIGIGLPLAWLISGLVVGTFADPTVPTVAGCIIDLIALCIIFVLVENEWEPVGRMFSWTIKKLFRKHKLEVYKQSKLSQARQEIAAMYDSLKNKYCIPIKFTDEK